jgi:archaellum component FlaC
MTVPKFDDKEEVEVKSGGMKLPGGMTTWIIVAIIALAAAFGVNQFLGVPKTSLDSQLKTMNETITAMQSDLRASKDSIKLAIDGISGTVDSKVSNSMTAINSQLTTLSNTLETVKNNYLTSSNQIATHTSQIDVLTKAFNDMNTQVKAINETLSKLSSTGDIATLTASLKTANDKIALLDAQVKKLNDDLAKVTADVAKLTTTTTTSTTTTPAVTGLTATLVGTSSMPLVSGTNTINIVLTNNTGKALYAEQLNVQLQFLNPTTPINTWGLTLTSTSGTFNSPSYSIVSGIVNYSMNAGVYMGTTSTQTISIVVNASSPPVGTINFVVTLAVNGYSQLQ